MVTGKSMVTGKNGTKSGTVMTQCKKPHQKAAGHTVLFACNYNSIRSPIAAALLQRHGEANLKNFNVYSAGVYKADIDPMTVDIMKEVGIDLSNHTPCSFKSLQNINFDTIVSLTPEAQHNAARQECFINAHILYWPTHDPAAHAHDHAQLLEAYRGLRQSLEEKIVRHFG